MTGSGTDYTLLQSTMTPDRNHTASVTDTNGSQTSYTYNASTEQLTGTSTYNPETGKTISTNRVYNASNGRQTQMYIDSVISMSYAYKNGGLSSLTRKSYRNGIGQWQSYGLAKDVWGNTSAVTVSASTNGSTYSGTRTLASYTYAANNGNLTGMTCGNGDSISYSYDSFDRLIKTRYNDTGDEILYTYNAEGSLAQLELRRNSTTVGIFSYEYDSLGRLIRSRQTDGTNTIQRTEHLYDAANRLKQQNYTLGNKKLYNKLYLQQHGRSVDEHENGTGRNDRLYIRRLEAAEEDNGHKRQFYRFDNKIRLPHRQRGSDLNPAGVLQGY